MSTRKKFLHQSGLGVFSLLLPGMIFPRQIQDEFKGIVLNEEEGEIYQWPDRITGEGTARVTIKIARVNGSHSVSFLSESFVPGDAIKIHKHSNEDELIFLHKGTGILTLDEKEYAVRSGAVALVPKGAWHGLKNTGTENIEMRFGYTPSGFEGYFRELGTPVGQPFVRRSREERIKVGLKYGLIRKDETSIPK